MDNGGTPFFWLSCWGPNLSSRLTREEGDIFLRTRAAQGFNAVILPLVNRLPMKNVHGSSAFRGNDPSRPVEDESPEGFWNHMDALIETARESGLYVALIPLWGTVVDGGNLDEYQARIYGSWLGRRYGDKTNVLWMIGGDAEPELNTAVWQSLARSIRKSSPRRLMTFHPGKKRQSSRSFHNESWMDFNLFQSGAGRIQESSLREQNLETLFDNWTESENWRNVMEDYCMIPPKPTMDGETGPELRQLSSEEIRRSAYWSVFAGAAGFCCPRGEAEETGRVDEPLPRGAEHLIHLKNLIQSVPGFDRVPEYSCLNGDEGVYAGRLLATGGKDFLFIYSFIPRSYEVFMDIISGEEIEARWFNPRTGRTTLIGCYPPSGTREFRTPRGGMEGEDWVLILSDRNKNYFS